MSKQKQEKQVGYRCRKCGKYAGTVKPTKRCDCGAWDFSSPKQGK